jgi:lysozyme family protein
MQKNFDRSLDWVLAHEGGYVNHPKDPGGATNMGVTQRTYDADLRRRQLPSRSVRLISMEEVKAIYRSQYWEGRWR